MQFINFEFNFIKLSVSKFRESFAFFQIVANISNGSEYFPLFVIRKLCFQFSSGVQCIVTRIQLRRDEFLLELRMSNKMIYYINTDKCQDFSFYWKIMSLSRAVKILFLSFTCEDSGVAMVINMISQLQEGFPLRSAAGSFEISFTKWLRGAKTVQSPVTFSMSCQIFTSILFSSLKNIQEDFLWQTFCDRLPL